MWRSRLVALFPALAKLQSGYVVGGAIRDLLIGREPADVDIACRNARAVAESLGGKVIRLGNREHLSAYRVPLRGHIYDFAELLGGDIDLDLARRDFTVNAMAIDLARDELLDPHRGKHDLHARIVRMVKPSNFDDDPLRALKAVRMCVKYEMLLDDATCDAIRARAAKILTVAPERVTYELSVIFTGNAFTSAVELLDRTGLLDALGMRRAGGRDDLSLAASFALLIENPHDFADRWRWSDALLHDVMTLQRLIEHHDRVALYDAGESLAQQLQPLVNEPLDFPDFALRPLLHGGEIPLPPGPELGRAKRALLEAQIRGEVRTRDEALAFVAHASG
ncbi:MAG TPA: hypothetical protein VFN10_14255 [Thermoanaerobaculia bacterium]|nr:hypothetical protein [Thermoanaerobaculia bacterium]